MPDDWAERGRDVFSVTSVGDAFDLITDGLVINGERLE